MNIINGGSAVFRTLQKINKKLYLDVYGEIPNQLVQQDFEHCQGIRYHGFVNYEKVKDIINEYIDDLIVGLSNIIDMSKIMN